MILVCPSCSAKNRVPEEKLDAAPNCGQCHAALLPRAPIELTEQNFSNFMSHTPRRDSNVFRQCKNIRI